MTETLEKERIEERWVLSIEGVVAGFLNGRAAEGNGITSTGDVLYSGKNVVARRCPDGSLILPTSSISNVALSDALMGEVFANKIEFTRHPNFANLLNTEHRVNELKRGEYDNFLAVAKLFNFSVHPEEIRALKAAKAFKLRVEAFFGAIEKEENERVAKAEEEARKERARKNAIDWDSGTGAPFNRDVKGLGGGQRLRLSRAGSRGSDGRIRKTDRVETSTGHTVTPTAAKRAFDFASQYWHGGRQIIGSSVHEPRRSYRGYRASVTETHLHYGCQNITRKEAERFADSMNWERAKPA